MYKLDETLSPFNAARKLFQEIERDAVTEETMTGEKLQEALWDIEAPIIYLTIVKSFLQAGYDVMLEDFVRAQRDKHGDEMTIPDEWPRDILVAISSIIFTNEKVVSRLLGFVNLVMEEAITDPVTFGAASG